MPNTENPYGDWEQRRVIENSLFIDGVYSFAEPHLLKPEHVSYLRNVDLRQPGMRKRVKGVASYGVPSVSLPLGMVGFVTPDENARYLVGIWGNQVHRTSGDGSWVPWGTAISLPANVYYHGVQGQVTEWHGPPTSVTTAHQAIFFAGISPWNANTNTDLAQIASDSMATVNASMQARAIAWWQGRLWCGNISGTTFSPNHLAWSEIFNGHTFSTTWSLQIDPFGSDEITALAPARSTRPRLYIFKEHSIWALEPQWGSGVAIPTTENTLDTANSNLVMVSERVGCVATRSVVYSGGGGDSDVFFWSHDGLRSIKRVEQDVAGGLSEPLSAPIQDVVDQVTEAYRYLITCEVWDDILYIALPVNGSVALNTIVAYDLRKKEWVGEFPLAVQAMTVFDFNNMDPYMYALYGFTTTENVLGSGATSGYHCFRLFDESSFLNPSAAAIVYREDTRAMTFGDMGLQKRWSDMELRFASVITAFTATVYTQVDDFPWTLHSNRYIQAPASSAHTEKFSLIDLPVGERIRFQIVARPAHDFAIRALRAAAWVYEDLWI